MSFTLRAYCLVRLLLVAYDSVEYLRLHFFDLTPKLTLEFRTVLFLSLSKQKEFYSSSILPRTAPVCRLRFSRISPSPFFDLTPKLTLKFRTVCFSRRRNKMSITPLPNKQKFCQYHVILLMDFGLNSYQLHFYILLYIF